MSTLITNTPRSRSLLHGGTAVRARRDATGAPDRRRAGILILAYTVFGLGIAVMFLVSAMVLFQLGLNYEAVGGNPLEKLHPGNLLVLLGFVIWIAALGPLRTLSRSLIANPGMALYLLTTLFLVAFTVFIQKEPFTPLVDTFIPVVAIFLMLQRASPVILGRYATILHCIFAANALIALYEYLTGNRLTPYVAGTVKIGDDDWRATALIGHPLANAIITGSYILTLASKGGGGLPTYRRALMLALQLSSMVAFGARASLVTMLLLLSLIAIANLMRILGGRMKTSITFIALLAMALPLIAVGLFALQEIGFFDRLIERFVEDKGSASTRIAMFELFKYIPQRDFLFGPDSALIGSLKGIEGIESGIESFWVAFVLSYGLLPSALFFIGLFAFCLNIGLSIRPYAFVVFAFFFIVASTSVSLSAKSPIFGMVVAIQFIMLRRPIDPSQNEAHR